MKTRLHKTDCTVELLYLAKKKIQGVYAKILWKSITSHKYEQKKF